MAKVSGRFGAGVSKIRFVVLEAELHDGDLTQVTQAISNALSRGGAGQMRSLPSSSAATQGASAPEPMAQEELAELAQDEQVEEFRPPRAKKPRKFPTPKVLSSVDLEAGDEPFEKFANERDLSSELSRYLAVAYWFKTFRNLDTIGADHVFTCYKRMGWGTEIRDFFQPFRDLARNGRGEVKDSKFTINHIGESKVERKKSGK